MGMSQCGNIPFISGCEFDLGKFRVTLVWMRYWNLDSRLRILHSHGHCANFLPDSDTGSPDRLRTCNVGTALGITLNRRKRSTSCYFCLSDLPSTTSPPPAMQEIGVCFCLCPISIKFDIPVDIEKQDPPLLWRPQDPQSSRTHHFRRKINSRHSLSHQTYEELWKWSTENIGDFWDAVWDETGVIGTKGAHKVRS